MMVGIDTPIGVTAKVYFHFPLPFALGVTTIGRMQYFTAHVARLYLNTSTSLTMPTHMLGRIFMVGADHLLAG
jgi:hypothetical protein